MGVSTEQRGVHDQYRILTEEQILTYAREKGFFSEQEQLTVQNLADGKINHVFRVRGEHWVRLPICPNASKMRWKPGTLLRTRSPGCGAKSLLSLTRRLTGSCAICWRKFSPTCWGMPAAN